MSKDFYLSTSTADLHDRDPDRIRVVDLQFRRFGKTVRFYGRCVPLRTQESHLPVLEALRQDGRGRVLVVDGAGSLRVGVMGDRLAAIGVENGWVGIVINGAIRDTVAIDEMPLGVRATGTTARRNHAAVPPSPDAPIRFGGVTFCTGDWIYVDEDAVIVSEGPLDLSYIEAMQSSAY